MQLDTSHPAPAGDAGRLPIPPLSQSVRLGLLWLGLGCGAALYLLWQAPWADVWDLPGWEGTVGESWRVVASAALVLVPLWVAMAVTHWRSRRLWCGTGVLALVIAGMGGWTLVGLAQAPSDQTDALLRLVVALSLWWLVALAWFQGYLEAGHWRIPYARLFVLAWNNALVLALTGLCVNLVWAVLWLWAALLALLGVTVFAEWFAQPWFIFVCSGLVSGMGLWLARTQERPIQMARQTLAALGRMLLPLMAWVVVLFVLALGFTGLQRLWDTHFAAGLLMGVLLVHIWLVNAVYQDGSAQQGPYGRGVLFLVYASLWAMLVLASVTGWGLALRVAQYGWTALRVWAAVGAALLWLYAAGYVWAVIRHGRQPSRGRWLALVARVNRALSWLVLVVLLALQTPVLDPHRISARSQLAQLADGNQEITLERLSALKFDHGAYGAAALAALAQRPVAQAEQVQEWVQQVMLSAEREASAAHSGAVAETIDIAQAKERISVAGASQPPAEDWWDFVLAQAAGGDHRVTACLSEDGECTVLSGDWDRDGQTDHLLCDVSQVAYDGCLLTARSPRLHGGGAGAPPWQEEGMVGWPIQGDTEIDDSLRDALQGGRVEVHLPRWPQWQVQVRDGEGQSHSIVGRLQR